MSVMRETSKRPNVKTSKCIGTMVSVSHRSGPAINDRLCARASWRVAKHFDVLTFGRFDVLAPLVCAITLYAMGCQPYRVEYHSRPSYYRQASAGQLADRVELDDGTVIVYRDRDAREEYRQRERQREREADGEPRKRFEIREEQDDGTIVLRGLMPEHVLANLLTCLQNEEYELIYDQLLSQHTRRAWEGQGRTFDEFEDYFATHRAHMIRAVNVLFLGLTSHETVMEHDGPDVIELRLLPQYVGDLRFIRVRMIMEEEGMKLINIR